MRKTSQNTGSVPTKEAATKLILLAIRNFETGGRGVRERVAAHNQRAMVFAGHVDACPYLKTV